MRRSVGRNGWRGLAAGVACSALVAAVAVAETTGGIAPPGDCAEPRVAVRGEPAGVPPVDDGDDGAQVLPDPDAFPVAGGPRDHFDPRDVAATRGAGDRPEPPAPPVLERGPCDAPGAVCLGAVPRGAGAVVISEPPPGTPDQPGAGVLR
jgi:hypothetical protein